MKWRRMAGRANTELGAQLDPPLKGLLDHLAEQLAREYVALMEAAASTEGDARGEKEDR